MSVSPVALVAALSGAEPGLAPPVPPPPKQSFARMIFDGVERINQKMIGADALAASFAVDDTIPPHQVLFALDEAHESFSLMMQVRARLVDAYQDLMRMQL